MNEPELGADLKRDEARRQERFERDNHIAEDIALAKRLASTLGADAGEQEPPDSPHGSTSTGRSIWVRSA